MTVTRDQIAAALRTGLSNAKVAAQLSCDRHRVGDVRRALSIPAPPRRTLEEKWAGFTRPVDGGHLEWTGERQKTSGTPMMHYQEKTYTAARIAFRIRHGHDPRGYAYTECGHHHCVAPEHVDDEAGRARAREQLRYLTGGQERPAKCVHGHDQVAHGRYGPDGVAYCEACKAERRRAVSA